MEHSTLITLPIEVHYKYAQYIDLRDLAALMFSCKEFFELFGTDLQLQKIVYEHTEQRVIHNKLRRPIKHLFMENRANYALKIDDVEFLKYTLPSLSYKDIALILRPFSSDPKIVLVTKPSKKSVTDSYLQKIFDYDAAKCFDFLLETFVADVVAEKEKTEEEQESEIFNVMLLVAIVCFKRLQLLGSVSKLPHQKTIRVFLTHFQKWKEVIFAKLATLIDIERPLMGETIYSKMVFESLVACSKEIAEFHIDLGMRIPSRLLQLYGTQARNHSVETILEYIAATKHHYHINNSPETGTFNYLMKLGAPFDPNAPYLPLALKSSPFSPLSLYLEKLGANINALLKPTNETLLNSVLTDGAYPGSVIEYLLYRGAKLTKEEEVKWLNNEANTDQYKVAKCQQVENYNPLKTTGKIPDLIEGYLEFYCNFKHITLYPGRRFVDDINMSSGDWEVIDGKLILQDMHKKIDFGSYDEETVIEGGASPLRTYSIVKTCLDFGVALASDDPKLTEDEKVRQLLCGSYYQDVYE